MSGLDFSIQSGSNELTEDAIKKAIHSGGFPNLKELYDVVGYPAIVNLIQHYGGDDLYIPKQTAIAKCGQHEKIYAHFQNTLDYKQTARVFDLSVRTIYKIVGEQKKLQHETG